MYLKEKKTFVKLIEIGYFTIVRLLIFFKLRKTDGLDFEDTYQG